MVNEIFELRCQNWGTEKVIVHSFLSLAHVFELELIKILISNNSWRHSSSVEGISLKFIKKLTSQLIHFAWNFLVLKKQQRKKNSLFGTSRVARGSILCTYSKIHHPLWHYSAYNCNRKYQYRNYWSSYKNSRCY